MSMRANSTTRSAVKRGSVSLGLLILLLGVFLFMTMFYLKPEPAEVPPIVDHVKRTHAADGMAAYLINWIRHVPVQNRIQYGEPARGKDGMIRYVKRGVYADFPYTAWMKEEQPGKTTLIRNAHLLVRFDGSRNAMYYGFEMTSPEQFRPPAAWCVHTVPVFEENVGESGFPDGTFKQVNGLIMAAYRRRLLGVPLADHLRQTLGENTNLNINQLKPVLTSFSFPKEITVPALGLAEILEEYEAGRYQEAASHLDNLREKVEEIPEPYAVRYRAMLEYYQRISLARTVGLRDEFSMATIEKRLRPEIERERSTPVLREHDRAVFILHSALAEITGGESLEAESAVKYLTDQTTVLAKAGRYLAGMIQSMDLESVHESVATMSGGIKPLEDSTADATTEPQKPDEPAPVAVETTVSAPPPEAVVTDQSVGAEPVQESESSLKGRKIIETVEQTAMVQPDELLGDFDGDGEITIRDYVLMDKQIQLNSSLSAEESDMLDLNRNGTVDERDATLMYWRTNPIGDLDGDLEITRYDLDTLEEFIEEYGRMEKWERPDDISRFDLNGDDDATIDDLYMLRQKYKYMYQLDPHW
ncbi:MAG: dockerin type I domain-containing protein [bacterium]|jgi:hypothetical protein|nr:dockerin type I domain-containing protein [bacterium]